MILRRLLLDIIDECDRRLLFPNRIWTVHYLNLLSRLIRRKVRFGFDAHIGLFWVSDYENDRRFYMPHPRRAKRYRSGVDTGIKWLLDSYSLSSIELVEGQVVIDCGANCGELGAGLPQDVRYVAVEPDPHAFHALLQNCSESELFNFALGEQDGEGILNIATASADSSLVASESSADSQVEVTIRSLDSLCNELEIAEVAILKLEAEGYEPEVIRGATDMLRRTRYIALDSGPERNGMDTLSGSINTLFEMGFRVLDSKMLLGRVLLVRE